MFVAVVFVIIYLNNFEILYENFMLDMMFDELYAKYSRYEYSLDNGSKLKKGHSLGLINI